MAKLTDECSVCERDVSISGRLGGCICCKDDESTYILPVQRPNLDDYDNGYRDNYNIDIIREDSE